MIRSIQRRPADCVVFGVLLDDATAEWPGRNRLLESISEDFPVFFLQRARGATALFRRTRARPSGRHNRLYLVENALIWSTNRWTRRLGRVAGAIDRIRFRRCLHGLGFRAPLLWLTVAEPPVWRGLPRTWSVFDCMDPCFEPHRQADHDRREAWVVRRSDFIFASARTLFRKMSSLHPHVALLPNAASDEDLDAGSKVMAEGDRTITRARRPRIGYLGTIDWRFDADIVASVAERMPDVDFVLGGRLNAAESGRVSKLRSLPNVTLTGPLDVSEGQQLIGALDVGIVPFLVGDINDAVNPVKVFTYLSFGKPVVTTDLEECRANPWVVTARNDQDFEKALRQALEADPMPAARREYARQNTWAVRADYARRLLKKRGMLP